jgi:hypothetical protein
MAPQVGRRKIFVLSLHRTGTQSTSDLFQRAGLRSIHWPTHIAGTAIESRWDSGLFSSAGRGKCYRNTSLSGDFWPENESTLSDREALNYHQLDRLLTKFLRINPLEYLFHLRPPFIQFYQTSEPFFPAYLICMRVDPTAGRQRLFGRHDA